MPTMPRSNKKATKIAWRVLQKPPNMHKEKHTEKMTYRAQRLLAIETKNQR